MIHDLFSRGDYWESVLAVNPPPFFTEGVGFMFSTDELAVGDVRINFIDDDTLLPGNYTMGLSVQANPLPQFLYLVLEYQVGVTPVQVALPLGEEVGAYTQSFTLPTNINTFSVRIAQKVGLAYVAPAYLGAVLLPNPPGLNQPVLVNGGSSDYNRTLCYDAPVDYNNGQFIDPRARTLAQIREDVVRRLGYSANTVRPDMAALVDNFINDANEQLYERYPIMRLERWWTWQTQPGQRFYDVPIDCTKYLDLRHVKGAWLQDDDAWFPLVAGINPLLFNQVYQSLPQYYELRERIELWPAPDKPSYLVHLKGEAGVSPMTLDTDFTTVDSRACFLMALANAKAHYGQQDAVRYDRQCEIYIGRLTAGSHYSKRYVPRQPIPVGLPLPIRQVPGG